MLALVCGRTFTNCAGGTSLMDTQFKGIGTSNEHHRPLQQVFPFGGTALEAGRTGRIAAVVCSVLLGKARRQTKDDFFWDSDYR